ncbi:MAG: MFS transporter [Gaiellales bacterium]
MSRQTRILVLAVASQAAFSMISFGLPAIGADIRSTFGLGPAGFGAVYAAVGIGSALALVPAGMLVDRIGARRMLIGGGIVNAAGLVAAGLTTEAVSFSIALFVAGIGGAAVPVAGMTSLLREFPPQRRGLALGWRQLGVPLGGTLGSLLLPAMVAAGGVRLAMMGAGAAAGITAIWFSTVAGDDRSQSPDRGLGGVMSLPGMRLLLALGLLYVWALGSVLAYYIPAAEHAGVASAAAAAGFTLLNVCAAGSRVVWGRRADRDGGNRRLQTLRMTGVLACVASLAMPLALAAGAWAAIPATVALAFGVFGFNGVLYLVAGEIAGPDRAGRAVGLASMVVFGWGSLAAPIAGLAIEHSGYPVIWAIAGVTTAAGASIATVMLRSTAPRGGRILDSWATGD